MAMVGVMLFGPQRGPQGRRSNLSINTEAGVVVRVFDRPLTFSKDLYYSVGIFDQDNSSLEWGESQHSGSGKKPSIALIYKVEKLYAVEVHCSQITNQCFYRVGTVDKGTKKIEWKTEAILLCSGTKPKVSAINSGKIVVVNEQSHDYMKYHIGELVIDGADKVYVTFTTSNEFIVYNRERFHGVEPDISINSDHAALIYRSGFSEILSRLGKFTEDELHIIWGDSEPLLGTGINPCISLNSRQQLVETHQTKYGRQIRRNNGYIQQEAKAIQWCKESLTTPTLGEYPSIALSDNGFVAEVHKTNFGKRLFQSHGELKDNARKQEKCTI